MTYKSFKANKRARKPAAKRRLRQKQNVKTMVRREVSRQEETKIFKFDVSGNLLHNVIYTCAPLGMIATGTDDNQYTGRKIYCRYVTLSGTVFASANANVRVIGMWTEKSPPLSGTVPGLQNYGTVSTTGPFVATDFFTSNQVGSAYAPLNNKLGNRVVYDRLFQIKNDNPQASNVIKEVPFKIRIPVMRPIQFGSTIVPKVLMGEQFMIHVIGHQAGYSAGAATTIGLGMAGLVTYKDA